MNRYGVNIFITLFFSIFVAVTGVGIVIPLLPVYAHDLGASGFYISMIFGSFSLSRTFLLPYFGRMSDRRGRKPYIVLGLLSYGVISLGFMMAETVETLILLRFLHGIASAMVMPVAQAYVGDITPPGKEGFYMGLFSMSMFAGLSLGPFMGGIINSKYGLGAAFAGMGILAAFAFILSLFFLPPIRLERVNLDKRKMEPWKKILSNRVILGLVSFRFAYTTCVGVIWCFLPLYMKIHFDLGSSASGTLVMLMVLIGAVFHVPFGYAADKLNKMVLMMTGGTVVILSMVSFEWSEGFYSLLASVSAFGIGGGIAVPALSAIAVSEGKKAKAVGSVMAILTMAHSMGMLTGSLIAGVVMDFIDLRHAFPMGSVIMLAGMIYMLWCFKAKTNEESA